MQLLAYGAQDVYLTGNPAITFFKTTYRRHTNFTMDDASKKTINQKPFEPVDGNSACKKKNKNFTKELLEKGLYFEIYDEYKFKVNKLKFKIDDCEICFECPQNVKTKCGHKYCHGCFIKTHVLTDKCECSFCRQDIGNSVYVYDDVDENISENDNNNNNNSNKNVISNPYECLDSEDESNDEYKNYYNNNDENENDSDSDSDIDSDDYFL